MKTLCCIIALSSIATFSFAQENQEKEKSPVTISGYIETYYLYNFNKPTNNTQPDFFYSFNRHNEVNLNLGFVKAAYQTENVRANLALATGTYMNANLATEPGVLKNIFEANVGVRLSKKKNLWIDAGVFSSHIGFESAIGKDCWNLTRSILADNSPYYESGAKISYTTDDGKWFISGLLLNGWQRMQRIDGNSTPAGGHQLTYKPNSKIILNSSSFIGNTKPDSAKQMRYFHNFYGIFQLTNKLGLTAGFDIGAEQKSKGSSSYNTWYSPVLIARYSCTNKINIAGRAEYYCDVNGVIIHTNTPNGFQTFGYSLNIDYNITNNVVWRIEGRELLSKDKIFTKDNSPIANCTFLSTSLAVAL